MDERVVLQNRIDELLDAMIALIAERDLLSERLAYVDHLLQSCREANGWVEA